MVASPPAAISLPMLLPLDFSSAKDVARNVLLRLLILLVCTPRLIYLAMLTIIPDCPEREATYIITTGGINDPEKV